jgi:hypothetical protein
MPDEIDWQSVFNTLNEAGPINRIENTATQWTGRFEQDHSQPLPQPLHQPYRYQPQVSSSFDFTQPFAPQPYTQSGPSIPPPRPSPTVAPHTYPWEPSFQATLAATAQPALSRQNSQATLQTPAASSSSLPSAVSEAAGEGASPMTQYDEEDKRVRNTQACESA